MVNRVPKIAKKSRKNAACLLTERIMLAQKALASVAIEGNRLAERLLADIAADKGEEVLAFLDSDESAKNVPAKVPRNVLQNVPVNDCRVLKNLLLSVRAYPQSRCSPEKLFMQTLSFITVSLIA